MEELIENTAYVKMFYLGGTGLGPSLSISKNAGSFGAPASGASMTEVGSGWYSYSLQAADTDTLGPLAYAVSNGVESAGFVDRVVTAAGSDPWAVPLPGSYPSGQAGYILGHLVNATDPWAVPLPGSYPSGQAGYILGHEGAGSDPWATLLPGSYPAGQAGHILGTNLNAAVSAVIYLLVTGKLPKP